MPRSSAVSRAVLLLAAIVAADQLAKALVRGGVAVGDSDGVFPGIEIVHVKNRGVAFGVLSGKPFVMVVVLLALAGLVVWFGLHSRRRYVWIPTGMLLGGALGNIIDRVRDGAVTDFIKLPLWPAFNIADMSIVFGVLALLWVLERGDGADEPT
ncbi:MAG: lspA [Solirubrobacterales bacterium]|nr:lspA [Solirubrobacterales bacterium]